MGRCLEIERCRRRRLGVNGGGRVTATGRIDLPAMLRTHRNADLDAEDRDMLGSLEVMADSSCEPLDRLIALEGAAALGVDAQTARTILGMY